MSNYEQITFENIEKYRSFDSIAEAEPSEHPASDTEAISSSDKNTEMVNKFFFKQSLLYMKIYPSISILNYLTKRPESVIEFNKH